MIDRYAALSGDRNPLHIDPEYGRASPFGSTIAHGLMTMALAAQAMRHWGDGAEIDIAFIGPVRPGEEVTVTGTLRAVEPRDGRQMAIYDISCAVGERTVIAGSALRRLEEREERP